MCEKCGKKYGITYDVDGISLCVDCFNNDRSIQQCDCCGSFTRYIYWSRKRGEYCCSDCYDEYENLDNE